MLCFDNSLLMLFEAKNFKKNSIQNQKLKSVKMSTLIRFKDAFLRPLSSVKGKPPIFVNPINLEIKSDEKWAVIGSQKTQFLKALASQYLPEPALSRTYPFLNKEIWPSSVIQFVEFKGVLPTAHLAARYEFFKDEFDETTRKFVIGNINNSRVINHDLVAEVFKKFKLEGLEDRWAMGLSNGQTRRARLARALIREPQLLFVDDPFLGLDPSATKIVSDVLGDLPPNPHVFLGLRYQDKVPEWITNIAIVDHNGIIISGTKEDVEPRLQELKQQNEQTSSDSEVSQIVSQFPPVIVSSTPLLEFDNISIAYRGQPVLTDLKWSINHGEKWHIRGNNGTGKSTLLSLITAEHPQSWNSKIITEGVPRQTGVHNFFDINADIGFTSPELHALFPQQMTVENAIKTGFVVGSLIPPKILKPEENARIEEFLKVFELSDSKDVEFRNLSISDQKIVLFIRAIIKNPKLLILDEALSIMEDDKIDTCKQILDHYNGALLTIGHLENEVPRTQKYIELIAPGQYKIGSTN